MADFITFWKDNMKYAKKIILLFLLITAAGQAQLVEGWRTFTDMKQVKHFSFSNGKIWAATSGGAFQYNDDSDNYFILTKTEGLNGSFLTTLTEDNSGKIWFGSQNGIIDVYNPSNNSFKRLLDIFNTERIGKQVNELVSIGDTIYAATDFGLSLIDKDDFFFYDTYFRFGTFASNIKVNSSFLDGLLYVCTEQGLAVQKQGAVNLSAPESWNVFRTSEGLPSNNALNLVRYKDTLLIATERGLAFYNGTQWNEYLPYFNNRYIRSITAGNDTLYILWEARLAQNRIEYKIGKYSNGNLIPLTFESNLPINQLQLSETGELYAATDWGIVNFNSGKLIAPNGPQSNQFVNLDIDQNGVLWAASGRDATGIGFYRFNGATWENFNTSTTSVLNTNSYHTIYASPQGDIYAGSWGFGFIRIKNNKIVTFDASNTSMQGIAANPAFLVIGGFTSDAAGNLWVMNHDPVNRKPISMLTPDSVWYHFSNKVNLAVNQFTDIIIDRNNTKWFISQSPGSGGLYYFNENNSLTDSTKHESGYVSQTTGLNSNTLSSIVIDRRGDLWVGSSLGINIITNLQSLLSTQPQLRISSVFAVRQQSVNAIAVDALNQKWIGTNQGILVLSSDGTNLIHAFDTRNSPLVSDVITSIAIDQVRGIVYAGTESGLSVIYTNAIQPLDSFDELFVYPNPLRLETGKNQQVTIDGLIRDSEIKILNVSGQLIRQFTTPGGKVAFWDGKDESGDYVSSGVYLIIAFDREANNIATGKVAVLRQ